MNPWLIKAIIAAALALMGIEGHQVIRAHKAHKKQTDAPQGVVVPVPPLDVTGTTDTPLGVKKVKTK